MPNLNLHSIAYCWQGSVSFIFPVMFPNAYQEMLCYGSYNQSIDMLGVEKLSGRRSKLCLNFAKRLEKHPKYSNWFHPAEETVPPTMSTRSDKTIATKYTIPIPFLTKLLNKHYSGKKGNAM